jgi:hypothetical protein
MHLLDPTVNNVHASWPHLSPGGTKLIAQLGVILFKLNWTARKEHNYCVHRTADNTKQDASHDQPRTYANTKKRTAIASNMINIKETNDRDGVH